MPSVRESILANVKTTMQGIAPGGTPAAGYSTPVKGVYRWGVDSQPSAMEAPLILVIDGGDAYDQSTISLLNKRLTVALEGWQRIEFEDDSTVSENATAFLADLERAILQDVRRGENAWETLLKSSEIIVQREAEPFYVVSLVVEIRYRTNLTNPSSQTP
jgi:hypothetical protein